MAYILECRHIDKTYQTGKLEVPVLHDVNFTMEEGEYVAIMGPSGSGKSTLMNLIGCLDRLTDGELIIDGDTVSSLSEKELAEFRLRKVGFVFQTFQLLPGETALENVELPLTYAKVPRKNRREIARKALERVGLGDRMDFKPSQLSGGQKQRVAIARAVVNHPKILLADEPTGALDSKSGRQVMELFRSLNEEGMSVLMITHDREIASYADRVVEIRDGVLMSEPGIPIPPRPEREAAEDAGPAVQGSALARADGIQAIMEDGFFDDVDEEVSDELEDGFFVNVEVEDDEGIPADGSNDENAELFGQPVAEDAAFGESFGEEGQDAQDDGEAAFAEKTEEAMPGEASGLVTKITDEEARKILEEEEYAWRDTGSPDKAGKTASEPFAKTSPESSETVLPAFERSDGTAVEILHLAAGGELYPDKAEDAPADARKNPDESDGQEDLPEEV